jgi:hypothetical protein
MKTDMAANEKLTKEWIRFLKTNQMVAAAPSPDGKLNYKRTPTSDDVIRFLTNNTHYSEEQINNAISMVGAKKGQAAGNLKLQNNPTPKPGNPQLQNNPTPKPGNPQLQNNPTTGTDLSTWMHSEMRPGERPEQPEPQKRIGANKPAPGPLRIKHDPNSVTDVEYRDIPNEPKPDPNEPRIDPDERRDRNKPKKKKFGFWESLEEDITEKPIELDEKDVEQIFTILAGAEEVSPEQAALRNFDKEIEPKVKSYEMKKQELARIKQAIDTKMTDSQRRSLWRMLQKDEHKNAHDEPLS